MSIKSLLKGETIILDMHHRGIPLDVDDNRLHLHKKFNSGNKKFCGSSAKFYFNDDRQEFEPESTTGADADLIVKEISKAFKKRELRIRFVKDVVKSLSTLALNSLNGEYKEMGNDNLPVLTELGRKKVKEMILRIAKYFGGTEANLESIKYVTEKDIEAVFKKININNSSVGHKKSLSNDVQKTNDYTAGSNQNFYVRVDEKNLTFTLSSSKRELFNGV